MTALFDHAVEAARSLPSSTQDDVARLLLQLAREEQPVEISDVEMATFGPSLAQADRGELATDDQVRAVWAKHGL